MRDNWKENFELFKELNSVEKATATFTKILKSDQTFFQYTTPPNIVRFVSKFFESHEAKIVADPACGTGSLLAYAKMITNASEAYGFDISPKMVHESAEMFPHLRLERKDTARKLMGLSEKVDLIVSALPTGAMLTKKLTIREHQKGWKDDEENKRRVYLKRVSDAIIYNSVKELNHNGMAIFLTDHVFLNEWNRKKMLSLLEEEGIYLNAAISIQSPKIPLSGLKFLMCVFSRKKNERIYFGGGDCVLPDEVLHAYKSGINLESVGIWSKLEDFIGFSENNIPLVDDPSIHKKILQDGLVSPSSLFEYFTLGDLMTSHGSTPNNKGTERIWFDHWNKALENVIYLRRRNPVSTIDKSVADGWKRGYFVIELNKDKVNNEYLSYLFTRSVGNYMLDTIVVGSVIKRINEGNLLSMPMLLPSLETQDTVVEIRRQIDTKMSELDVLKEMLHKLDDLDLIRAELGKVKSSQDNITNLLQREESSMLEFKSSLWRNFTNDEPIDTQTTKNPKLEDAVAKTICAFLNSEGGTLLIGVSDTKLSDGVSFITGIEHDYVWCKKNNQNQDGFGQSIENLIRDKLTSSLTPLEKHISKSFHSVDGKTICKIDVIPAPTKGYGFAVFAKVSTANEMRLFIRSGETTTMQSPESQMNYIVGHFMGEVD